MNKIVESVLKEAYDRPSLPWMPGVPTVDIDPSVHYNKPDKTFSAEISSFDKLHAGLKKFILHNPKTGNKVLFSWFKTDKDASDEDIYGWWYKSEGGLKFLLIND